MMERWQRTVDGVTEVWELGVEAEALTERVGREGSAPAVREQRCDTAATAEGVRRRMVAQRTRQGWARTSAPPVEAAPPAPRPAYPGLTDAQLDEAILRVRKVVAGDAYKYGEALHKSTGDYATRYALGWFMAAHGLVPAETMPGLWELLAQDAAHADPAVVFGLLARVPTGRAFAALYKHGPMAWFVEGSDRSLDELLFAAYQRDPAYFEARAPELNETARRALDFVRGRSGVAVDPARARALVAGIAAAQARSGLATNWELARLDDGVVTRPRVGDAAHVRAIALRFVAAAEWDAAMVAAALAAPSPGTRNVADALRACTAVELATLLGKKLQSFGGNPELAWQLRLVEHERDDSPEALLAAAETLREGSDHTRAVGEMLALVAAVRFAAQGKPVPDALVSLVRLGFFSGVYFESIRPTVDGLRALPRETAVALAERALEEPYTYARGLAVPLAWPDDALLGRFFDKDAALAYLEIEVVGRFGAAALPHLARVWEATPRDRRRSRHQQVLAALAVAADRAEPIGPEWDRFVVFHEEGGESLKYWDDSYAKLRARVLRGLPAARRLAVLLRAVREHKWPERAAEMAKTVLDDEADRGFVEGAFAARRAG